MPLLKSTRMCSCGKTTPSSLGDTHPNTSKEEGGNTTISTFSSKSMASTCLDAIHALGAGLTEGRVLRGKIK